MADLLSLLSTLVVLAFPGVTAVATFGLLCLARLPASSGSSNSPGTRSFSSAPSRSRRSGERSSSMGAHNLCHQWRIVLPLRARPQHGRRDLRRCLLLHGGRAHDRRIWRHHSGHKRRPPGDGPSHPRRHHRHPLGASRIVREWAHGEKIDVTCSEWGPSNHDPDISHC